MYRDRKWRAEYFWGAPVATFNTDWTLPLNEQIALSCSTHVCPRLLSVGSHIGASLSKFWVLKKNLPIFPAVMATIRKKEPSFSPWRRSHFLFVYNPRSPDSQTHSSSVCVCVFVRGYFYPCEAGGVRRTHRVMECLQLWNAACHTETCTDRQTDSHRHTLQHKHTLQCFQHSLNVHVAAKLTQSYKRTLSTNHWLDFNYRKNLNSPTRIWFKNDPFKNK